MRNFTLQADWPDFALFDDYEAERVGQEQVPEPLREALSAWNSEYREVITLSPTERTASSVVRRIAELDARGRALASALKSAFPGATLRYASEGLREPGNLGTPV